jgi:hypothetical protein
MSAAPAVVVDVLNSLLEAEQNSIIRFLGPGSPYLTAATAKLRDDLAEMAAANDRRSAELAATIDRLGGSPLPRGLQPEEQYLAYLSLRFLLPKAVDANQLLLDRYDNALAQLEPEPTTPPDVLDMVRRFRAEHVSHVEALKKAADEVLASNNKP